MIFVAILLVLLILFFTSGAVAMERNAIYRFDWAVDEGQVDLWASMASAASGVSAARIKAIIYIESRGKPTAQNPGDPSYGLMALEIPTASHFAGRDVSASELLADPQLNADLGAAFLAHLEERYEGSYPFGVWADAYNLGEPHFDEGERSEYGAFVEQARDGKKVFLGPGELESAFS